MLAEVKQQENVGEINIDCVGNLRRRLKGFQSFRTVPHSTSSSVLALKKVFLLLQKVTFVKFNVYKKGINCDLVR